MLSQTLATLALAATCLVAAAAPAAAGPCSDGIAELGRKLAQSPALGPVTTGALAGSGPAAAPAGMPQPGTPQPGAVPAAGTSADNRVGGTAWTKEMNAAAGTIAMSPDDVRRQQQGLPTAAAVAAAGSNRSVETAPGQAQAASNAARPDERASQAKMALEQARMLDQRDDASCRGALDKARELAG